MNNQLSKLMLELGAGAKSPADLLQRLQISQPTFSRLIARAGGQITSIGRGRAIRYAALRNVRGLGAEFPIYRITADGAVRPWGILQALAAGQFSIVTPQSRSSTLFDGLPYFLQDIRPQGFIGRLFPKVHEDFGLPSRIADWSDDDVLVALVRRGEDCIGDIVIGDESLERLFRAFAQPAPPIAFEGRVGRYPELADAALSGSPAGSSAGGEQPKFTATITRPDQDGPENVLIKLSPADNASVARRWRDLLLAEHHAMTALRNDGLRVAAGTRIVDAGGRVFLEVERFDRIGPNGRLPSLSLGALDDELYGKRDNWIGAAARLEKDKKISPIDAEALRFQEVYGRLIANSDQHFGNIALAPCDSGAYPYRLAPAYDVLPMLYAPINGEIVPREFTPAMPTGSVAGVWARALGVAINFWDAVAGDDRISAEFRDIALANRVKLAVLLPLTEAIQSRSP
jgi:hypothetical protein